MTIRIDLEPNNKGKVNNMWKMDYLKIIVVLLNPPSHKVIFGYTKLINF